MTERPRGVLDLLGADFAAKRAIEDNLRSFLASYGYRIVDTPALEDTDLYLRKSGADLTSRMYTFTDQGGHRLSLRPEFTASVIRAFIEDGHSLPLPQRWQYAGPVFRYEPGQKGRYRQATQLGCELIGSASPRADAEIVTIACHGIRRLGLEKFSVVVGHPGVALKLLGSLGLSERASTFLVSMMGDLGRGALDVDGARSRLTERGLLTAAEEKPEGIIAGLDLAESRTPILEMLTGMSTDPTGSRDAAEIVERFLRKLKRGDAPELVEKALGFVAELAGMKGSARSSLRQAEQLTAKWGLIAEPLKDLGRILEVLEKDEVFGSRITVDFGLTRGLAYYTGMVFEIRHGAPPGSQRLCGGGRYDGLVKALGAGKDVPALGFAYALESLAEAFSAEGVRVAPRLAPSDVLVTPEASDAHVQAHNLAELLRSEGKIVELEVRETTVKSSMDYARRSGIPKVMTVRADGKLTEHLLSRKPGPG